MNRILDPLWSLLRPVGGNQIKSGEGRTITIEYPLNPRPRYGHGRPPHRRLLTNLGKYRANYETTLKGALSYSSSLKRIPWEDSEAGQPRWENSSFYSIDAIGLYYFLASHKPKLYVEVGSGNSTLFARQAITDSQARTKVVSIDPGPRVEVSNVCDLVVKEHLEDADLSIFETLGPGDVVFVDSSHVCYTNSDVTVFFLEVLPQLAKGVLVQLHDIWLPYDYPPEWNNRFYSEQYLLACYLLSGSDSIEPLLANAFIWQDNDLHAIIDPLLLELGYTGWQRYGTSFWFRWRGLPK